MKNQNFYTSTGQHYMYRICLWVPQPRAGNSVIIHTPADHYSCSTPSVNESVRETKQFPNRKAFHGLMCVTLGRGTYLFFWPKKCSSTSLAHWTQYAFQWDGGWIFSPFIPLGKVPILGYKKGRHFQGSLRVNCPRRKGQDMQAAVESAPYKHLEEDCKEHHRPPNVAS